jgi:hypothetical protein
MRPYTDIETTDKYIIREFNENIDNKLPISLKERIFIPRHEWHRVIKGKGTLKLKIYKDETI